MIGFILVGHGGFAQGLTESVEMIAGEQANYHTIAFRDDMPLGELETKVSDAIAQLKKENTGILIFTDLLGGTPFNTVMQITQSEADIEVLTGTNLPMLIEAIGLRMMINDAAEIADAIVETGKQGLRHAKIELSAANIIEEDGI